jgi:GlcNAc-P-P-Und epimerase
MKKLLQELIVNKLLVIGGSGFIGTNLVEHCAAQGYEVLNFDLCPPMNPLQQEYWIVGDVLNLGRLTELVVSFQPDFIVDLAARTDVDENTSVDLGYKINIAGPANIIRVASKSKSLKRIVFTSTQYVVRPGRVTEVEEYYDPHTVYGQSKVEMEKLVRRSPIPCAWTLVRPTNVWGPWHMRYRRQLFRVMRLRGYLHPAGIDCVKSYAYVGNVVCQIEKILRRPQYLVDRRVFYVGDSPINLRDWVNAFSVALTGSEVRSIDYKYLKPIAMFGDFCGRYAGIEFPLTTSRLCNMVEDYLTPMEKTFRTLGEPAISLEEGVDQTVRWLNQKIRNGDR